MESVEPGCLFTNFRSLYKSMYKQEKQTNMLFFAKEKDEIVTQQSIVTWCPFSIYQIRNKELCKDNKVQETLGVVNCPSCGNEKSVCVSTDEMSSFFDSE